MEKFKLVFQVQGIDPENEDTFEIFTEEVEINV